MINFLETTFVKTRPAWPPITDQQSPSLSSPWVNLRMTTSTITGKMTFSNQIIPTARLTPSLRAVLFKMTKAKTQWALWLETLPMKDIHIHHLIITLLLTTQAISNCKTMKGGKKCTLLEDSWLRFLIRLTISSNQPIFHKACLHKWFQQLKSIKSPL
jgi:hypothetical protein